MKGNKIFDFSRKGFQDIVNIMANKINECVDVANDFIPRVDDYMSKIDWNSIINSDLYQKVLGDLEKTNEQLETKANKTNKNSLETLLSKDCNIVITGDSLSFNRYGFFDDLGREPKNYYPGMLSWSYMLRDAITRYDDNFKSVEQLNFNIKNGSVNINSSTRVFEHPMNGILACIKATNQTETSFIFKTSIKNKNIILYFGENSTQKGCSFDVYINDEMVETVDTRLNSNEYKGLKLFQIQVSGENYGLNEEVTITFKNFNSSSGNCEVFMYGVGCCNRNIYLTGKGGYTSTDILNEFTERVINYNPDLLFMVIGANDLVYLSNQQTRDNIDAMLSNLKTNHPNCEIVLLTTTKMDGYEEKTKEQLKIMYDLSYKYNTYLLDLVELFKNEVTSDWRIDNVHLTRYGNEKVCKELINLIMPSCNVDKVLINGKTYFSSGLRYKTETINTQNINSSFILTWNSSTTSFDIAKLWNSNVNLITSITKISENKFTITFSKALTYMPSISQYDSLGDIIIVNPYSVTSNSVTFSSFKYVNGVLTATVSSDWVNNKFNFVITI